MDAKILEQLQKYFGDSADKIDFEKAEEGTDIIESLEVVNSYKEEFPDDLKKAVGVIVKQAGFCDTVICKILEKDDKKKSDDKHKEEVSKSGAKFSKETMEKLKKVAEALEALKDILPELKKGTEASTVEKAIEEITKSIKELNKGTEASTVEKAIEEITKSVTELEKKKDDKASTQLTKSLEELKKRLVVVEKENGIKKSTDGQENDDEPTGNIKWPSLSSRD